jgi:hypothetical protein
VFGILDFGGGVSGFEFVFSVIGGTGKLPMAELQAMCRDAGFAQVRTYIASGNVVFKSTATPKKVKSELEARNQEMLILVRGITTRHLRLPNHRLRYQGCPTPGLPLPRRE